MAKEKKRGFFSWLGFGRDEDTAEPEKQPAEQKETPDAGPAQDPASDTETPAAGSTDVPVVTEETSELPAAADMAAEITEAESQRPPAVPDQPVDVASPETEQPVTADVPEPVTLIQEPGVMSGVTAPDTDTEQLLAAKVAEQQMPVAAPVPEHAAQDSNSLSESSAAVVESRQEIPATIATQSENVPSVSQNSPEAQVVDAPESARVTEQERPTREGFFARLKRSLVKTRQNLGSGFIGLFRGKKIDDDLFEELEEQLLIADVGVETTRKIIGSLTEHASRKQLRDAEALYGLLKDEMSSILDKVEQPLDIEGKTPFVILMVGVNGVGKTTTIGKLARQFQSQGKSVMLAAGDTFRAAAVEQLEVWGKRNNIPVVAQHTGADSASVIFDAIQAAKSRGIDVLIADTAGRLQNKSHLMEELKKITRVMSKLDDSAPHEVMLTLDASTGQNAISQAKLFNEAVGLSGITLTKLDGTAKGGVIFSVADQFNIPIRYIGVGEGIDDLRPFKAGDFIEALFARED
ncbi:MULTISPECIES: signal recognition particle-docking protein FtsY [Tatumella]|uniref:Signal recognition particle receptor FtsY n=1 Tax=Tatumella punctata TaxID=399969 RepID=A0ABW1VNZ4_9GAMM|nr:MULTISPECIES: signal recognition particle-docking protein FtsY [unclassified Tatumella]MBS0855660.1 signal recognition particle-docking protein FtsY [Tatumella sp. JGM16]MBS0876641.1 signal recognition particle-docking protein FtsY [Tatumella sp. JGM82]MBS0889972.1 signal recognition particle-docking protein FtsY [Tatumella sp. JGM94]MBS0893166.1 signal recognition particle-docking protein FtsY [Tatumella sp. JGM130]MBS0901216.1 signal recognition particle-docking protein FtsY [Tatumella sp